MASGNRGNPAVVSRQSDGPHPIPFLPSAPSSNRKSSSPRSGSPTTFPVGLSATFAVETHRLPVLSFVQSGHKATGNAPDVSHSTSVLPPAFLRTTVSPHRTASPARHEPVMHVNSPVWALMQFSLSFEARSEVRPLAPDELCCLILHHLTGPLRHPYIHHAFLPVSSNLITLTTAGVPWERMGFRSNIFHLSPHATGLTPGSARVHIPFTSSCALAFPFIVQGRRVSGLSRPGFSLNRTLPAISVLCSVTELHHSRYATAYGFG